MSFLHGLRKPKKPIVLAAALFSVCGLVFAAFTAFTSSGGQQPGSSGLPGPTNSAAGGAPSHPWLADNAGGLPTNHNNTAPHGTAHRRGGHAGAPGGNAFSEDNAPPPSGPANGLGPDDSSNSGPLAQGGGDFSQSSIFNDGGENFASAGGAGGSGGGAGGGSGGGSGGGDGEQSRCESLIGCTPGSPTDNPAGGNGDTDFTPTTPVPEPETYAMMLAGLGVMGAIAKRRKQRDNSRH